MGKILGAPDPWAAPLAAGGAPRRRAILARVARGEATVRGLAEPFQLKLPTVSKHLKVLRRAGLVTQGRQAQWRPCRLEAAPLKDVADWVERYRENWEERMGQLDDYLQQLKGQEREHDRKKEDGGK